MLITGLGAFKLFESSFTSFISEWIENCSVNGRCECFGLIFHEICINALVPKVDWTLFGQVLHVAVAVLNGIAHSVLDLAEVEGREPFSVFNKDEVQDSRYVVLCYRKLLCMC